MFCTSSSVLDLQPPIRIFHVQTCVHTGTHSHANVKNITLQDTICTITYARACMCLIDISKPRIFLTQIHLALAGVSQVPQKIAIVDQDGTISTYLADSSPFFLGRQSGKVSDESKIKKKKKNKLEHPGPSRAMA